MGRIKQDEASPQYVAANARQPGVESSTPRAYSYRSWALLRPFLRTRLSTLLLAVSLACLTVIAGIALLSVAGWFLTGAFLATAASAFNLFVPSAMVRGLSFLRIGSRYLERLTGHSATLAFLADVRVALFSNVARLQPSQLAQFRDGDLVARLVGDIDALDAVFLALLLPWISAVLGGAIYGAWAAWWLPVAYGWVLLLMLGVMLLVLPWQIVRGSLDQGGNLRRQAAQARIQLHDIVARHVDVVVFAMQPLARADFRRTIARFESARDRLVAQGSLGVLILQCFAAILMGLLLWAGMQLHQGGSLSAPLWVGMILGALGLFEASGMLMRGLSRIGASASAAQRVDDVMQLRPENEALSERRPLPLQGDLVLAGVRLQYARGDESDTVTVLDNISLTVAQGERIALVGPSGAGKSSLLAAIMRIVPIQEGSIHYGGVNLAQVDQAELYQRFALLSQDAPVFLGTIRQNLLIGNPTASDAILWHALTQAGLDSFVQSLADGLDTWVGESGRTLSVGQARRLCLARLLLTDAKVWLLDEPTAGLDRDAQLAFFRDLDRIAGQRTVILSTHADVPNGVVSRVARIAQGRLSVVDTGT